MTKGNNGDVIKAFVLWKKDPGVSYTGSVFFEGDVLYSYGHHYPIAYRMRVKRGQKIMFLFNKQSSTLTTNIHRNRFEGIACLHFGANCIKKVSQKDIEYADNIGADAIAVLKEIVNPRDEEELKAVLMEFLKERGMSPNKASWEVRTFISNMMKKLLLSESK